jgi:hypothetical protein
MVDRSSPTHDAEGVNSVLHHVKRHAIVPDEQLLVHL